MLNRRRVCIPLSSSFAKTIFLSSHFQCSKQAPPGHTYHNPTGWWVLVDSHQPVTFLSKRMFQANPFSVNGGNYYFSCNVLKKPTRLFGGNIFLSCCFLPIPFAHRSSYLVKNIPTIMGRQEPCFLIDFEVMETTSEKSSSFPQMLCFFFFKFTSWEAKWFFISVFHVFEGNLNLILLSR